VLVTPSEQGVHGMLKVIELTALMPADKKTPFNDMTKEEFQEAGD
jgi:hypothetical protein